MALFRTVSAVRRTRPLGRGPLGAAILDWSGSTADNFVIAPAAAFVGTFAKHGVRVTMAEARKPMGARKDIHLQRMCEDMPLVREKWRAVHNRYPTKEDAKVLFESFTPLQLDILPQYTGLIPGTKLTVDLLRNEYNLKIGVTTGFQKSMVQILLRDAARQGFVPDVSVAGDEVDYPRPYPHMVWENMKRLGILHPALVLKVGDTEGDVGEGLNAGAWTCALSHTSNYMDINSMEEYKHMPAAEIEKRGEKSRQRLIRAGAHYVVRDITLLPDVVQDINQRLALGESP